MASGSVALAAHYPEIVQAIRNGRIVPFLGAGINMCGRTPPNFVPGKTLPSGGELADHLAKMFGYPAASGLDLARVAQYIASTRQKGPLYEALADIFRENYEPTAMHKLIASIPARLRRAERKRRLNLIITTNYDDLMERALAGAGEPYDVIWYDAEGQSQGRFWHKPAEVKSPVLINVPEYDKEFELSKRPVVVLKIHGAIDRFTAEGRRAQDSFVITEDHYIEYLLRTTSGQFLPRVLAEEIGECGVLFVGYGLRDWNMRVFLRQIWKDQRLEWPSWAVQLGIDPVEERLWEQRGVRLFDVDLLAYATEFETAVSRVLP